MRISWLLISAAFGAQPAVVPFGDKGEVTICSERIVRITHRPTSTAVAKDSLIAKSDWPEVEHAVRSEGGVIVVETSRLRLELSASGATFVDRASGRTVLRELESTFEPSTDLGKPTYQVQQSWAASSEEGLFGGGSYQNGLLNYKNAPLEMIQYNTEAVVPFFTSSEGYGLLWDNYAWTYLNPPENMLVSPGSSKRGSLAFTPQQDGDYFFFVGDSFPSTGQQPMWGRWDGSRMSIVLTDPSGNSITVQDWDELKDTPMSMTARASGLRKGVLYDLRYMWTSSTVPVGLFVQGPEYGKTVLRSFVGELIDYYFVLGETPDDTIAGYREITGAAPLYGKWTYGFWQSKNRYKTQDEVVSTARRFRELGLPVDAFVQDWRYWGDLGWGPSWDPKLYPDPASMVNELHSLNIHFMVSVWSKFDKNTSFWKRMNESGWILGDSEFYDPFHARARELFYEFARDEDFSIGVDSLWMDATEPESFPQVDAACSLGSGNAYMNAYSLQATRAVSDGLRLDYPKAQGARVFTLTRSAFAGQQATGAALWTGDIAGNWDTMRRQIASAVNYGLSGMPYWTQDIGGFHRPEDQYDSADYHNLLTRWFQFGVFTPLLRVHGGGKNGTELWSYGDDVMGRINASALSLRMRLMPYIYSGFHRVEAEGYTMLRALPMDFPRDAATFAVADAFLFGDALLVTPIHSRGEPSQDASETGSSELATRRTVYFPAGDWVHFHTGEVYHAGWSNATFALDQAPAFARSGSIVCLGPKMQHSSERAADVIEVRVYTGRNASFTLFEDDGHSRKYQVGQASSILFTWNEEAETLSIGETRGHFDAMLLRRIFNIVFVAPGHGVGVDESEPDATIAYHGKAVQVARSSSSWVAVI